MSVREHWINVRVNPEELARIWRTATIQKYRIVQLCIISYIIRIPGI